MSPHTSAQRSCSDRPTRSVRRFPVVVVPTTTSHRGLSVHVEIDPGPGTGLDDLCYAQCELIRSISVRRLVHRLGRLDLEAGARIDAVVRIVLGH